ncbi:MAG TPA: GDP-mannose 4,6-dehydratase [Terriglobia bacterium]
MNILITGGAGFIGSHLSERCVKQGWNVAVIDDLSTGAFENIASLRSCGSFSYHIDSVFNAPLVAELVDSADVIFHLAAAVGVRLVVHNLIRTIETNFGGTETVLRAAAKKQKRVVIASSSEVYGKSEAVPFREDQNLIMGETHNGRWSYACSKMLDEFLGFAYWTERNVPVTVVRFFNTVGPRQTARYGMVVPNLVREALLGDPLTVYGSGEQRRCFGYVADIVEALVRVARSTEMVGDVVNIGNDQEISINDLAAAVKQITNSSSEITHIPYEEVYGPGFEDVFRRVPSLEKLERITGYRPTTSIDAIIRSVANDMAHRLEQTPAA